MTEQMNLFETIKHAAKTMNATDALIACAAAAGVPQMFLDDGRASMESVSNEQGDWDELGQHDRVLRLVSAMGDLLGTLLPVIYLYEIAQAEGIENPNIYDALKIAGASDEDMAAVPEAIGNIPIDSTNTDADEAEEVGVS